MNLVASAQKFPDHTALRMDYQVLTYARLDDTTARLARLMAAMLIGPGDRIGLMVPNVPEFGLVFYAALRCGAVVVPMNPLLTEREIAYYLQDSGAGSCSPGMRSPMSRWWGAPGHGGRAGPGGNAGDAAATGSTATCWPASQHHGPPRESWRP